jgi:hypothetical protein
LTLSLVRLLPAWLHAIADYAVAISLIVVALMVAGPGKAVAAGVVIGAVVLVVSLLTRYPLGLVKVLPFKVHSAGDYLAAVLLVASPFALGFTHNARGLTIFYIGAGVAVLLVSLITNYQYSPERLALTESLERADVRPETPPRTAVPSYPPQAAPPSYPPEVTPPSHVPEAAQQTAPVDDSWRTYSWQSRALVDQPRASAQAVAPVPPATAQAMDQPVTAEPAAAEPVPELPSPEPIPDSRPLREILAERAANRSVA